MESDILHQIRDSRLFIANSAVTISASMVDCAVIPHSQTLTLTKEFETEARYEEIDLSLSKLLPQFAYVDTVRLNPSCLQVI